MESKPTQETDRTGQVYVVSEETSIDIVKIEPADEDEEDVVVEDDDEEYHQAASFFATPVYFPFNETAVSSTTNFVPAMPSIGTERPETELQLKFVNELESEAILTVNRPNELQLAGDRYVSRCFDIVVRRRNYKSFPIQWFDAEGRPAAPFKINGAREVTYGPIDTPKGGDVIHQGARVRVEHAKEITITFETLGTYLSRDEKEVKKIRMHTAKHLELLCLDQEDGFILGSVDFQVVCVKRNNKQKQSGDPNTFKPMEYKAESKESSSDSQEAESSRTKSMKVLEQLFPRISPINLTYIVAMAKEMADK